MAPQAAHQEAKTPSPRWPSAPSFMFSMTERASQALRKLKGPNHAELGRCGGHDVVQRVPLKVHVPRSGAFEPGEQVEQFVCRPIRTDQGGDQPFCTSRCSTSTATRPRTPGAHRHDEHRIGLGDPGDLLVTRLGARQRTSNACSRLSRNIPCGRNTTKATSANPATIGNRDLAEVVLFTMDSGEFVVACHGSRRIVAELENEPEMMAPTIGLSPAARPPTMQMVEGKERQSRRRYPAGWADRRRQRGPCRRAARR